MRKPEMFCTTSKYFKVVVLTFCLGLIIPATIVRAENFTTNKYCLFYEDSPEAQLSYVTGIYRLVHHRLLELEDAARQNENLYILESLEQDRKLLNQIYLEFKKGIPDEALVRLLFSQSSERLLDLVTAVRWQPAKFPEGGDHFGFRRPPEWGAPNIIFTDTCSAFPTVDNSTLPFEAPIRTSAEDYDSGFARPLYRSPVTYMISFVGHSTDMDDWLGLGGDNDVIIHTSINGNLFRSGQISDDEDDFECDVQHAQTFSSGTVSIEIESWDTDGGWSSDDQIDISPVGDDINITYSASTKLWTGDVSGPYSWGSDDGKAWFKVSSSYDDDVGERNISWEIWDSHYRSGVMWGGGYLSTAPVIQNNGGNPYQDYQSYTDQYYKFFVEDGDYFQVTIYNFTGGHNYDLYLYDPDGILRDSGVIGGPTSDQVEITSDKDGWWYIKVHAATPYAQWFLLRFSDQLVNDYNDLTIPVYGEKGYLVYTYYGNSYYKDGEDFYKFKASTEDGRIVVKMTPEFSGDFDLYLYNPIGVLKSYSNLSGSVTDSVSAVIDTDGYWYFRVHRYNGYGVYSFDAYFVDQYEPDNSCYEYSVIDPTTINQTQQRSIFPPGDYDYIRFYGHCGRRYTFYSTGSTDTYGYLGTDDCVIMMENDDGGEGLNFSIEWCCTESDYYRLWIRGYSAYTTGSYTLNYIYVADLTCNIDEFEIDDACTTALPVTPGSYYPRTINRDGLDIDWYTFTTSHYSDFTCTTFGLAGDTRMWLYRGDCSALTEVAYNNDGGFGLFSRIEAHCQPPGTYYIKVDEQGNNDNICDYIFGMTELVDQSLGLPLLISPADSARTIGNLVNFSWTPAMGATGYKLVVNGITIADGEATVYNGYPTVDCYEYNWHVEAYNDCIRYSTESRMFRENGTMPVPLLESPDPGVRLTGDWITLSWHPVSDCDGDSAQYLLYFGTTTPPAYYTTTGFTFMEVPVADCYTYYWQVRAFDGYEYSGYSSVRSFQQNGRPSAPALSFPADGEVLPPGEVILSWNPSTDCDMDDLNYHWFVDTTAPPVIPYLHSGTTIETVSRPFTVEGGHTYFWRVYANDGYENGPWSAIWHFLVQVPSSEVTIQTDIPGGIITADSTNYFSPYTVNWAIGSVHQISLPSPQLEYAGVRYLFDHWSDGEARVHEITVPDTNVVYTAYLSRQYQITITYEPEGAGGGYVEVDAVSQHIPYIVWWDEGTTHYIEALDSSAITGARYNWINWSDGGAIAHEVTPDSAETYTAYFDAEYYLEVNNGGHGSTTGSGWYAAGTSVPFSCDTLISLSGGIRVIFSHWNGVGPGCYLGNDNPAHCIMNGPITQIAQWQKQYRLIVQNPEGHDHPFPPVGIYWYDSSAVVIGYAESYDDESHMYCIGYIGTGSLVSSPDTSFAFSIISPSTVEWQWDSQLLLIVYSEYGSPSPAGTTFYDPGMVIEASSPLTAGYGPDIRAYCEGWVGSGSAPDSGDTNLFTFTIYENSIITWLWKLQYRFTVNNPGDYDNPHPPEGDHWYDAGATVSGWINSRDDTMFCIGYTGSGVLPSAPGTTFTFILLGPSGITWNWAGASSVCQLLLESDHGCFPPPGLYYYLTGSWVHSYVWPSTVIDTADSGTMHLCTGWSGSGSPPPAGDSIHVGFHIYENSSLFWHWRTKYRFRVINPLAIGGPVPPAGVHWFDSGVTVYGLIDAEAGTLFCAGYLGTGSLDDGFVNYFSFDINEPSSVEWLWTTIPVALTIYSDYGEPSPPVGNHYVALGREMFVNSGGADTVSPGERWVCIGYWGTGSVPGEGFEDSLTFIITDSSSITWLWSQQYRFTVQSAHGSPEPPVGEYWFDPGTPLSGWVNHGIYEWPDSYFCAGYNGTGSLGDGIDTTFSFVLNAPSGIQWLWLTLDDTNTVTLSIASAHGEPSPSRGLHYYLRGTVINAYVNSPVDEGFPNLRFSCSGFSGTGSVPATGDSNYVSFTIYTNSTLTWNWTNTYRFTVNSDYGDPEPPVGSHWFEDGSEVNGWINRFEGTMVCYGYDGSGSLGDGIDTSFSFDILTPSGVTWLWDDIRNLATLLVISPYGHPYPPVGLYYFPLGSEIWAFVADSIIETSRLRSICVGWDGYGSVPPSGDAANVYFTIYETSMLTWLWTSQFYVSLDYSGTGDYTPEQTGEGWYFAGDTATVFTDPWVGDSIVYAFTHWSSTPLRTLVWDSTHFYTFVTVDTSCSLVANYVGGAIPIFISKVPFQNAGGIILDDYTFPYTGSLEIWLAPSSYHDIGVTTPDSSDSVLYTFDHWWDDLSDSNIREIGPVEESDTFIAQYYRKFLCIVKRTPPHLEGFLEINRTAWLDEEANYQSFWWAEGDTYIITVSENDFIDDSVRYSFLYWNDGLENPIMAGPIDRPSIFTAYYSKGYKCLIIKDPYQDYGSITLRDSTYESIAELVFWGIEDSVYQIGVSPVDVSADSVYLFEYWSDGGPLVHNTTPISSPKTFTAFYNGVEAIVRLCLNDSFWYIGTLDPGECKTMDVPEVINVENCGTINIDLGLYIYDSGRYWEASYTNDYNRFILRARFDSTLEPPAFFHPMLDYIKYTTVWSTDYIFGPMGYNLEVGSSNNLWLQFVAPTYSSVYEEEQMIQLTLKAKIHLP
ncbi:PPC domain-containing protein [bacterium]|nr:PPC domain-containing protein [bacterium]